MKVSVCHYGTAAFITILMLGCGNSNSTVSGTVTYQGRPVDQGFITFFPGDKMGTTKGVEIRQGKYEIIGLSPGKKIVQIAATPKATFVPTAKPGDPPLVKVSAAETSISPEAIGNHQSVEITAANNQTLHFHLQGKR